MYIIQLVISLVKNEKVAFPLIFPLFPLFHSASPYVVDYYSHITIYGGLFFPKKKRAAYFDSWFLLDDAEYGRYNKEKRKF